MKFLFALLGVALAANSYLPLQRPLPAQSEFRFRYEAALSSGLPVSQSDAALTRIQADVTVQIPSERHALIQFKNILIASENAVEGSTMKPIDRLEKRVLSKEHERLLELPVRFSYRHGIVSELQFASEELPWSANIKRAVINMLQINLKVKSEKPEENYFVATEKTIEGECEVAYSFVPENDNTLVTKAVNFDKCERRGDVAYNQRFVSECSECDDYKTIVPQTVYNYKIEKEQLKEVEVRSVYTVSLKEQQMMRTETRARLTLLESTQIRREIEAPKGEKQELIYSNEYERSVEEFYMNGDEVEQKPFKFLTKKVEMVTVAIGKIAENKKNEPETVHMLARLVQLLRISTQEELHMIHQRIYKKSEKKEQTILEHALAIAGTKNTIQHLLSHVELISVPKTVQLLKSIQETPFPSEKIADLLIQFTKTEVCRREPAIRQSVWLAYGSIVRGVVVPTQEKTLAQPPKHLKEKFVSVMKKQWEQAETVYEKILALKTFANAGIDTSIVEIEKIILDKKQPTVVRMEAIHAVRLMAEQMPRKIVKVLMPLFVNGMEKNELRMLALLTLVQCKPNFSELSLIVRRMEREPNQHVAVFTYSLLTSLAKSSMPAHKELSALVTPLIRTTLYRPEQRILSRYLHLSTFKKETLSGLSVNFGTIFGKDSAIPKSVAASLNTIFGGNWNKWLAQVGFSHQNIEQLFNKVLVKLNKVEKKSPLRASRISHSVSLLKDLARKMNIRVRESVSEEPHAMIYLRYKQMDYAVFPIDEQLVDEMIEKYVRDGSVDMRKVERLFNKDSEFDFTHAGFFFESIVRMPTTVGLPLTISSKLPTVLSMNGLVSIEKVSYGVRARLQAQPSFASTHVHVMSIWTPIFEHGVKIVRSAQIATPVNIEAEITMKKEFEIVLRQQMPEQKKTLIRIEARPIAFVRIIKANEDRYNEAEEKTISLPKFEKLSEERTLKTEYAGLEILLSGNTYRQWTLENVLLGEHQTELVVRPTSRTPKEITVRMAVEGITESRIEGPKIEKLLQKELSAVEGEWERSSDNSRREYLHKMVRDMKLSSAYKSRVLLTLHALEKSEIELRTECEGQLNFCRLATEIRAPTAERRDWKLKSVVEVLLPRPVSSIQELKEQKHREIQLYTQTMWGSEEQNKIEFVAQLEQSQEQRNLAKEPKMLRGLPAYEQLKRLARLNQIKAVAKYELSPKSELMFDRLFDVLKAYTLWNSQLEIAENEPRRVFVQWTFDSIVPSMGKLVLQTPEKTLRIQHIRLPYSLPMIHIARLPKNIIRHSPVEKSECSIENGKVNTFDDVIFRAPLSTCYTVVAKDCSEEPRYAVLVKNVEKNSEEKMVKIIYENNEYELQMRSGELKASLNGRVIRSQDLEENKIEKIGEELYIIDFDEVVVRFDGYTAKVLLGNTEMNTQCGLCGHFDGEKKNDYRTAADEETEDIEEFHRSFILKTEECEREVLEKKQYKKYTSEEYEPEEEDNFYSEKKEKKQYKKVFESEEESSEVPEKKIMVQEFAHRICFSLEPVPQCPEGMTEGRTVEQKVHFGCKPRHDSEARRVMSTLRRGGNAEVEGLKMSFVDSLPLPKTCVVA